MSYIIGSFNMFKMSGQSDENISKNWREIASIIKKEKFDVIAMQEAFNPHVIDRNLMPRLGKNWDFAWNQPKKGTKQSAEGYAYIWNTKRLKLIETSTPFIFTAYGVGGKLVRPPFVARFTSSGLNGGSFFELRLINTHIAFGKPPGGNSEMSDMDYRKQEMDILANEVYSRMTDRRYGNNMPAYTIMMGDYNLCLGVGSQLVDFVSIRGGKTLHTVAILLLWLSLWLLRSVLAI